MERDDWHMTGVMAGAAAAAVAVCAFWALMDAREALRVAGHNAVRISANADALTILNVRLKVGSRHRKTFYQRVGEPRLEPGDEAVPLPGSNAIPVPRKKP